MKWIARVFVFTATLVFGTFAASLFWFGEPTYILSMPLAVTPSEPKQAQQPLGIKVMYAGWESGQNGEEGYLKFIILNGQDTPVQMKANGADIDHPWRCGTGMQNFQILPGGSTEFRVALYEFLERPNAADQITAGFYLRSPLDEESKIYYSEPLLLPAEFRNKIQK